MQNSLFNLVLFSNALQSMSQNFAILLFDIQKVVCHCIYYQYCGYKIKLPDTFCQQIGKSSNEEVTFICSFKVLLLKICQGFNHRIIRVLSNKKKTLFQVFRVQCVYWSGPSNDLVISNPQKFRTLMIILQCYSKEFYLSKCCVIIKSAFC